MQEPRHNTPTYWRMRAEEFRTMAECFRGTEPKAIMTRMAKDCDRLAERTDEDALNRLRKNYGRLTDGLTRWRK